MIGVFALFSVFSKGTSSSVWGIISVIVESLIILGLYSFAFKKPILNVKFWKLLFWIGVGFMTLEISQYIYSFISLLTPLKISFLPIVELPNDYNVGVYILVATLNLTMRVLILTAPPLYAIYRLGYPKRSSL